MKPNSIQRTRRLVCIARAVAKEKTFTTSCGMVKA
jgi:hypothetical protein